MRN
ncbi:hypothetical protein VCHC17A2_0489A, partial [Vibrio cholerae HC-17A2]|jgi:hypothetical protein